ncbi:MAG: 4-hydroxy-3-methylbut-2-enyl diphosphate reductase [Acidobacteria bacterium]|nr:4-hydroxy-3-methylbut-2-enyl diphosphate reductase [Acidobacteriota bacterium]
MAATIFRKGLDLKHAVAGELARDYHSRILDRIRESDFVWRSGRLTLHLAREFGFCYGVDRAVDYAYQTRRKFPDRTVFLTGEIIHNPHVNDRLRNAGIRFLSDPGERIEQVTADDIVILPAFGVTIAALEQLVGCGCTLVDTTCGSVLNVWKNVRRYARDGFTAIIHGKVQHEETQATASQVRVASDGRYVVVLDCEEAGVLCEFIRGRIDAGGFLDRLGPGCSPGFDPARDLVRVGLANQTTMLMSESIEVGDLVRGAMLDRYGEAALPRHYRAFDTICSATQDRQDAVVGLLDEQRFDLAIVIGGYNSSNTRNLARICAERVATYHISDPSCLEPALVRHLPPGGRPGAEIATRDWLPGGAPLTVALTAGASTPDNIVGEVVERLSDLAGGELSTS